MKMIQPIMDRLSEPSTYAGLSAAAIALGIGTDMMSVWVAGISGFFAFLSIILKEVRAAK